jgi:hypothetical protein
MLRDDWNEIAIKVPMLFTDVQWYWHSATLGYAGTAASNKEPSNVIHCIVSAACVSKTCSYQKVFRSKL